MMKTMFSDGKDIINKNSSSSMLCFKECEVDPLAPQATRVTSKVYSASLILVKIADGSS
jgi:hypothetical protein